MISRDETPIAGKGQAKRAVLLYLAGGATQFETWNPKKKGSPNMGEAEPINTSVEGIEIGSVLGHGQRGQFQPECVGKHLKARVGERVGRDDVLEGKKDNDIMRGGPGSDACNGDSGVDTAVGCEATTGVP